MDVKYILMKVVEDAIAYSSNTPKKGKKIEVELAYKKCTKLVENNNYICILKKRK